MNNVSIDIIRIILEFDNVFIRSNGEIIRINKIDKNDIRYNMLLNIPKLCIGYYLKDIPYAYIYIKINTKKAYFIVYVNGYKITQCLENKFSVNEIKLLSTHKMCI
jgi:hypothetical protein